MKLKKFVTAGVLALALGISTVSCAMMQDLFDDKVVTTRDNVTLEGQPHTIPADLNLIPVDVRKQFEEAGKEIVLVDKSFVKDPVKAVDIDDPDATEWVDFGLGIAKTLFPGVAILEGVSLLFSKRKRKHYKDAVVKVVPANGKVEVGDAVMSLARAWGLAHSSSKSKEAFGEEVKKKTA